MRPWPRTAQILLAAFALALLLFPLSGDRYWIALVTRMMSTAIFALSLEIVTTDDAPITHEARGVHQVAGDIIKSVRSIDVDDVERSGLELRQNVATRANLVFDDVSHTSCAEVVDEEPKDSASFRRSIHFRVDDISIHVEIEIGFPGIHTEYAA